MSVYSIEETLILVFPLYSHYITINPLYLTIIVYSHGLLVFFFSTSLCPLRDGMELALP